MVQEQLDRNRISLYDILEPGTKAYEMFDYLYNSPIVQSYLRSANRMAVSRLGYTDHGPTHAMVAAWNALKAYEILDITFKSNIEAEAIGDKDDTRMAILAATYLHDIGMVIHRKEHSQSSVQLARPILEKKITQLYSDMGVATDILSSILHGIYAHDDDTQCLTLEAGCVKIGDGCDMTKGRTTVPFSQGKVDIHSISAMAINNVTLSRGNEKALRITVSMDNPAGVFQVEAVLMKKLSTSGLRNYTMVDVYVNGDYLQLSHIRRLHLDIISKEDFPFSMMSNEEK